jgi:trimeric autotransporter adhesin
MTLSARPLCVSLCLGILLWHAPSARALTDDGAAPGGLAQFRHPGFSVIPSVARYAPGQTSAVALPGVAAFLGQYQGQWEAAWDERGNRPNLLQGGGIPLLPGRGNTLKAADIGLAGSQAVTLPVVEGRLRQFMGAHPALFRVAQTDLRLHPDSGEAGPSGRLWLVDFDVFDGGVPIEGARVFFRINSGNIIQFGTELVGDVHISTRPTVTGAQAVARALRRAQVDAGAAEIVQAGALKIYPELTPGEAPGGRFQGIAGTGYAYRLVREVDFRRAGDHRTYRAVVDASSGGVLELYDTNQYTTASVTGGIFPNTNTDAETNVPLPNVAVRNRGHTVTDENGEYNYGGGFAIGMLAGPLVAATDTCGADFLFNNSTGNLDFGTSGGTDCTTPGAGGKGNTHASRTAFFQLNRIKKTALSLLPSNTWLPTQLGANTNLNQTCNAFWDGTAVNFFKSGGGCSNTGEIAAVMMHEFGHGLDQNTGGAAPDGGSGEAVGDITAFLETRQSCIGPNFQPGVPCHNCSSTGCTGVRDLTPFSAGGAAPIASPITVTNNAGMDCGRFACGVSQPCRGPMGYECHCESYIGSSAIWDLTGLLVSSTGSADAGYAAMQQLWYASLFPSKSAYQVASGGQCNPSATVNGCGSTNWYTVLLAVDDDDGNLGNGTPNGCRIWQAFNNHGIACGAQPPCFANP